eukprot:gene11236-8753_t
MRRRWPLGRGGALPREREPGEPGEDSGSGSDYDPRRGLPDSGAGALAGAAAADD